MFFFRPKEKKTWCFNVIGSEGVGAYDPKFLYIRFASA